MVPGWFAAAALVYSENSVENVLSVSYRHFRSLSSKTLFAVTLLLALLTFGACKRNNALATGETMYVSAPQANLRDHVSTVYNRVGTVKNGDKVDVLERQKRFVRVRTENKTEGWIELRALVTKDVYEQFQKMAKENRETLVQGKGSTRNELNMHVTPGRETETLYQLPEGAKVEILKRSTTQRATPEEIAAARSAVMAKVTGEPQKLAPKKVKKPAQPTPLPPLAKPSTAPATADKNAGGDTTIPAAEEEKPKAMDDWWLVRDQQGHTGWVLARMVDLDIPLDVIQYAEGQRIQAAFVLNTVQDSDKGAVAQYLVLLNDNKDGLPYDFNQVRVFTWNLKRHRYETAYRERGIIGYFPARVSNENFGKDGVQPVFVVRKQSLDGNVHERKYRLFGNVVRQVLAPGEQPDKDAKLPGFEAKTPVPKSAKAVAKGAKTQAQAPHKKR